MSEHHAPFTAMKNGTVNNQHSRRLMMTMSLTFGFLLVEVIGSIWTGSLALLADAGHMLVDVAGVGMSLLAMWFARKPPSPTNTYGYMRLKSWPHWPMGFSCLVLRRLFSTKRTTVFGLLQRS